MRRFAILAVALVAATPASAVTVKRCDDGDTYVQSAAAIAEPWEKNTRTFYNGEVRVALMDTGGEPACCSMHLLILAPDPRNEDGSRSCWLVNNEGGMGFVNIDFTHVATRYDAGKGLLITFPYALYSDIGRPGEQGTAHVRVNLASGSVTAE